MFGTTIFVKLIRNSIRNYPLAIVNNFKYSTIVATNAKTIENDRYVIMDFVHNEKLPKHKNEQLKFPLIWLRDNCQCSQCFDSSSKSRTMDWNKFKINDAQPKSLYVDKNLKIVWNDNHVSTFDFDWLYDRNFTAENRRKYIETSYRLKPILWSKDEFVMNKFEASDVFGTDDGLRMWLESLARYGVSLIKNAPKTEDQIRKLANHIGFIRRTQYGDEYSVRAVPNATNYAYTSNPLQLHTDLPYYDYKPGVTILHCIHQTKSPGAFSLLTDGFNAAEKLRKQNPAAFDCLSQTMVNWSDYGEYNGKKFVKIFRSPVICLDSERTITRINQSVPQRDSFFSVDVEKVDEWYAALRLFVDLLCADTVDFKLEPGNILAFSNIRLLHGRTGYVDSEGDVRHLIGAYIDWDEIYSRLRELVGRNKAD